MGFIRRSGERLVPLGSLERLLNTLVFISLPRRLGHSASSRHFLSPPSGPLLFQIFDLSFPYNTGFSRAMFFCQDVTDHCTLAESSDSHIFVCRDHSAPPLLGGKRGMGSLGFRWSYADIWWFWIAAQTALTFISHVSLQGTGSWSRCSRCGTRQRKCRCSRL